MSAPTPAVRMRGIVKQFGEHRALDGVDFDLLPGEIHALLGENGAGKSTLMRLLAGVYSPTEGRLEIGNRTVRLRSPRDAARHGIGMVHQHFTLVQNFTVAENLALALPEQVSPLLSLPHAVRTALELAEGLGWKLDPNVPVWQLPVGVQQRLEIVKVLARNPNILIFDEPTAVLAPIELEELFSVLRRLRSEGKSLVFISHKLNEVLELCDRVSVLRRGRNAGTVDTADTAPTDLARRMVGPEVAAAALSRPPAASRQPAGEPVLTARDLWIQGDRGVDAVRGLSFEVRAGEIFGLAGVDGNGQAELAETLAGLRAARAGRLEFAFASDQSDARRHMGYIPQDRQQAGLVTSLSIRDNLILELQQESQAAAGPFLRWSYLNQEAEAMRERYDVRAASLQQPASTLSGGNQQKIVIARALHRQPRLLVAVNPTRGLDVGATAYVHEQLRRQREKGAALLLISTELDEVRALSDRIGVLYEGELMGVVGPDTSRAQLGLLMGGQRIDARRTESDASS